MTKLLITCLFTSIIANFVVAYNWQIANELNVELQADANKCVELANTCKTELDESYHWYGECMMQLNNTDED